jgi:RHS repeat-associated protein
MAVYKANGSDLSTIPLKLTEHYIYGSSRLGVINRNMDVDQPRLTPDNSNANLGTAYLATFTRGSKLFEFTNHLGNVLFTATDAKVPKAQTGHPSLVGSYSVNMVTAVDYTPFGMIMQGMNYSSAAPGKYRYGFNGKEWENSTKGNADQIDYGERPYDNRGVRFWSVDPLTAKYPWLSPYQYAENSPIANIDLDGLEKEGAVKKLAEESGKTALKVAVEEGVEQQAKVVAMKGVEKVVESPGFWSKFLPGLGVAASRFLGVVGAVLTPDWAPNRNPNERPNPFPQPLPKLSPEEDNSERYITIYRGLGETEEMDYKSKMAYEYAKAKIAVPKGLIPDNSNKKLNDNPETHVLGETNSIYTSWTLSSTVAERFAKGEKGDAKNPIVLVKRVKLSELINPKNSSEYFPQDLEVLLKGVQQADSKYEVKSDSNKTKDK